MNKRPKIVYPDASPGEQEQYTHLFSHLQEFGDFSVFSDRPKNNRQFIDRIHDADGVLLGWDLPGEVMKEAKNLQVVSFSGTGAEKFIDMQQAHERNIVISNCPGYADHTVAEHALALLLAAARRVPKLDRELRSGIWNQIEGIELRGKRIGLIGFGGIGAKMADFCQALGMHVSAWTRNPDTKRASHHHVEFVTREQIYRESDIISLHLASTAETHHLLNDTAFDAMKNGAVLINTARGELIEETALLAALISRKISAAALDVFVDEPLPSDHPLIDFDNVVLTPHVGYNTPEATEHLFSIAVNNLVSFFQGQPVNRVDAVKH